MASAFAACRSIRTDSVLQPCSVRNATWGDMINKGRTDLDVAAHIALFPALAMFFTVLALNYVGDRMQERFEPRESVL